VETGERLSAYLAGELSTDDARALEAELARKPALRTRLERLRRLEAELERLPDVGPDPDFSSRLREAVTGELSGLPLPGDELGRRRAERAARGGLPRWVPAFAGAAAVLVLIVGGIAVVGGGLGGGDEEGGVESAMDGDAGGQEDSAATLQQPEGEMEAADTAIGPVVVSDGVSYDEEALAALPGDPRFDGIVAERLASGSAEDLASAYQRSLQQGDAAGDDAREEAVEESAPAPLQIVGSEPVSEDDLAAIARCLETVLADSGTLIPVYAELATLDGEPVIVFGLASVDPDTSAFTRIEVWAVSRADCEVRFLSQQDR
jgi:hypothetical protein